MTRKPWKGRHAYRGREALHALTECQPWGSAIVWLGKDCENRDRMPPAFLIGRRFAIHQGLSVEQLALTHIAEYFAPRCSREAVQRYIDARRVPGIHATARLCCAARRDGLGLGPNGRQPCDAVRLSRWWTGPIGLHVVDVLPLPEVMPCPGDRGWWCVPLEIEERILAFEREERARRAAAKEAAQACVRS